LPTVALVSSALLYRGYVLARRHQVLLNERWTNLLTMGCVGFFIADEFLITRTFLQALVHLVLFVMLVRLFSAQSDRDHYLLAGLSFAMVLAAAVLTVDSTFLLALAGFVLVGTSTFILMEMMHACGKAQVQGRDPQVPRAYRKLSFAIATIAPVLLVLIFLAASMIFFILPRVSAGYFSAYRGGSDLTAGFSDRVELGRIGQIQQSRAVVMHVRIDGDATGGAELKLRGVTLNSFDGRSWANTREKFALKPGSDGRFNLRPKNPEPIQLHGRPVHYQITMEPFVNDIFFLLANPQSLQGNYRQVLRDTSGNVYDLDSEHPVVRYEAESLLRTPNARRVSQPSYTFPPEIAREYLQLPAVDPRVTALAKEITARASTVGDKASEIQLYLRSHFGYTLQLPTTPPQDPIANFLFERRQGHCEYFASSMAVMLRSLGIPSRVVNGFSGGEFNDVSAQYVIRASEAHSWVEAYIPGEGWVEFDPTPAGGDLSQPHTNRFMLYMDAMASFWRDWIVNYDLGHQIRLTQDASRGSREIVSHAQAWAKGKYDRLLAWARKSQEQVGKSTVVWGQRVLIAFVIVLFIVSVPRLMTWVRKFRITHQPRRAPQLAATLWYERMLHYVARHGWEKAPAQTPTEFASGIKDHHLRTKVEHFTKKYENARFGNSAEEAARLPELYEEVKSDRSD